MKGGPCMLVPLSVSAVNLPERPGVKLADTTREKLIPLLGFFSPCSSVLSIARGAESVPIANDSAPNDMTNDPARFPVDSEPGLYLAGATRKILDLVTIDRALSGSVTSVNAWVIEFRSS